MNYTYAEVFLNVSHWGYVHNGYNGGIRPTAWAFMTGPCGKRELFAVWDCGCARVSPAYFVANRGLQPA